MYLLLHAQVLIIFNHFVEINFPFLKIKQTQINISLVPVLINISKADNQSKANTC